MASEQKKEAYQEYVKQNSPKTNLPLQMGKAFIMGGLICCIGQFIVNIAMNRFGIEKDTAAAWCSMFLILLSAVLTGRRGRACAHHGICKFGGCVGNRVQDGGAGVRNRM